MLEEAIRQAAATPLTCLTAVDVAERACRLERMSSMLEAVRCATLAAAEQAIEGPGAFKHLGYRNACDYVADEANVEPGQVRRLSKTGRWLLDFPVFAEAFADGHLTHRHVVELSKLDKPMTHHHLIESQAYLVEAARRCDFVDFVNVLIYWLNGADPDGDEPIDHVAKTGCSYRKHSDGSVSGRFFLDPLSGQLFRKAIDREIQRLFREESEDEVRRSIWQRTGQALLNQLAKGAGVDGPMSVTPLINVVVGQELAENLIEQLAGGDVEPIQPDYHRIDRRCELDDGTPLHPRLAAVAVVAGRFRRIVFDTASRPVDVAVKARGFPPWMKQVLLIKARGRCQIPGCDAPLPWLQADHIMPYSRGGPTMLGNGQILCDPHNKWKRDGWEAA
jgi:hypothetical protein